MLSDISRIYAYARQETAFWQAKHGFLENAEKHLLEAERLYPQDKDSYYILAQVYIEQKKCDNAQEVLEKVKKKDSNDTNVYLLMTINASFCYKDEEKTKFYQEIYQKMRKEKETLLKQL